MAYCRAIPTAAALALRNARRFCRPMRRDLAASHRLDECEAEVARTEAKLPLLCRKYTALRRQRSFRPAIRLRSDRIAWNRCRIRRIRLESLGAMECTCASLDRKSRRVGKECR